MMKVIIFKIYYEAPIFYLDLCSVFFSTNPEFRYSCLFNYWCGRSKQIFKIHVMCTFFYYIPLNEHLKCRPVAPFSGPSAGVSSMPAPDGIMSAHVWNVSFHQTLVKISETAMCLFTVIKCNQKNVFSHIKNLNLEKISLCDCHR